MEKKEYFANFRISYSTKLIMDALSTATGLNKTNIFEIALYEIALAFSKDLKFEGIDFKEKVKIEKIRALRDVIKVFRTETKSKDLFLSRIKSDLWLYYKKNMTLEKMQNLLDLYRAEAFYYSEPVEIIQEIDKLKEKLNIFIGEISRTNTKDIAQIEEHFRKTALKKSNGGNNEQ